jgi:hypothetical protein
MKSEIRRSWLKHAIRGLLLTKATMASTCGGSPEYWAALIDGNRPIDDDLARAIECHLMLPDGWLDRDPIEEEMHDQRHNVIALPRPRARFASEVFDQLRAKRDARMKDFTSKR